MRTAIPKNKPGNIMGSESRKHDLSHGREVDIIHKLSAVTLGEDKMARNPKETLDSTKLLDENQAIGKRVLSKRSFERFLSRHIGHRNPTANYESLGLLGEGGQGCVYLAKSNTNGTKVAIKIIPIPEDVGYRIRGHICGEIAHLRDSDHKNIVKYRESYVHEGRVWLVMAYVEGLSVDHLNQYAHDSHSYIREPEIATIVKDILQALHYLHSRNVAHRDIKSENVVINARGRVKLVDLGLAARITDFYKAGERVGTVEYCAPEMVHDKDYDEKIDIWSLGILIYELVFEDPPYIEYDSSVVPTLIRLMGKPPYLGAAVSPSLKDFLDSCFEINPAKRPSALALLKHPFLQRRGRRETLVQIYQDAKRASEKELKAMRKRKA